MKRWRLFEFEDLAWLPAVMRNQQTDFLSQMGMLLRIYAPVLPLLERTLELGGGRGVVDLCSGAGGPWRELLKAGWTGKVVLTDRYPNLAAFARIRALSPEGFDCRTEPVDARQVPADLDGVRVLFNSFHHFGPEEARAILQDAVRCRAAIGIFEIAERTPRTVLAVLFGIPLLVFAITPLMRPLTISRLFWTYCLPVVPLFIVWDGLVSILRAYSSDELAAMAGAAGGDYHWEQGRLSRPFPGVSVTYLVGRPRVAKS